MLAGRGAARPDPYDDRHLGPGGGLSVDWYGPGGWLVAYEIRDAAAASLSIPAPVGRFDEPGRYRAVLRSGRTMLAEDAVVVRPGA